MSDPSQQPTVAIAGGGMAGLTAAYYLAKRGYKVTLYEATDRVGGALSAVHVNTDDSSQGVDFECSPHMFGDWYDNFFELMREIGVIKNEKSDAFQYSPKVGFLQLGQPSEYTWLTNNGSIRDGLRNLFSGVDSPANLFLYWYTIIDILTQDFSEFSEAGNVVGNVGDIMSLNGYVITRPWSPERVVLFLQEAMVDIWAVDSFLTSIAAFASSARYQAKSPTPTAWITTHSNSYDLIVKPLKETLEALGVTIECNTRVAGVTVVENPPKVKKVTQLELWFEESTQTKPPTKRVTVRHHFNLDYFIMAVPRFAMAPLIGLTAQAAEPPEAPIIINRNDKDQTTPRVEAAAGEKTPQDADLSAREHSVAAEPSAVNADSAAPFTLPVSIHPPLESPILTIAELIPELAGGNEVEGVPLAMLYVPLTKKLPDIPLGYVGLRGSEGSLSFINVPYLADKLGAAMVLAIGISKFGGIPGAVDAGGMNDIHAMDNPAALLIARQVMVEFQKFVPFDPEIIWWAKVVLKTNTQHKLFLNTVGSMASAPKIHYDDRVANLFFAVETKENPVQIATVEGAVIGGLQAARKLWELNPASDHNRNDPIVLKMPKAYKQAELWALKIGLFPWAVAAKFWSDVEARHAAASRHGAANALAETTMQFVTAPFWFGLNTLRLLGASRRAR